MDETRCEVEQKIVQSSPPERDMLPAVSGSIDTSSQRPGKDISPKDAAQKAIDHFASLTRDNISPLEIQGGTVCRSSCVIQLPLVDREMIFKWKGDDLPCSLWECDFRYGDSKGMFGMGMVVFKVTIDETEGTVSDSLGLSKCFARTHHCKLVVTATAARKIAQKRFGRGDVWLQWDPTKSEFVWVTEDDKVVTSAHKTVHIK